MNCHFEIRCHAENGFVLDTHIADGDYPHQGDAFFHVRDNGEWAVKFWTGNKYVDDIHPNFRSAFNAVTHYLRQRYSRLAA